MPGFTRLGEQPFAEAMPGLGGSGRVCGGRRKYVRVGLVAASMRLTPPQTRPDPPFDSVSLPWETRETAVGRLIASVHCYALPGVGLVTAVVWEPTLPLGMSACCPAVPPKGRHTRGSHGHRPIVEGPAGVGVRGCERHGSGVYARRVGQEPNPGLAVCAGQRTRASRDQAYMDVFTASPAYPPPPAQARERLQAPAVRHNARSRATPGTGRTTATQQKRRPRRLFRFTAQEA